MGKRQRSGCANFLKPILEIMAVTRSNTCFITRGQLYASQEHQSRKSGTLHSTPLEMTKRRDARTALRKIGFPACPGGQASSLPSEKAGKMPTCRVRLEA